MVVLTKPVVSSNAGVGSLKWHARLQIRRVPGDDKVVAQFSCGASDIAHGSLRCFDCVYPTLFIYSIRNQQLCVAELYDTVERRFTVALCWKHKRFVT